MSESIPQSQVAPGSIPAPPVQGNQTLNLNLPPQPELHAGFAREIPIGEVLARVFGSLLTFMGERVEKLNIPLPDLSNPQQLLEGPLKQTAPVLYEHTLYSLFEAIGGNKETLAKQFNQLPSDRQMTVGMMVLGIEASGLPPHIKKDLIQNYTWHSALVTDNQTFYGRAEGLPPFLADKQAQQALIMNAEIQKGPEPQEGDETSEREKALNDLEGWIKYKEAFRKLTEAKESPLADGETDEQRQKQIETLQKEFDFASRQLGPLTTPNGIPDVEGLKRKLQALEEVATQTEDEHQQILLEQGSTTVKTPEEQQEFQELQKRLKENESRQEAIEQVRRDLEDFLNYAETASPQDRYRNTQNILIESSNR